MRKRVIFITGLTLILTMLLGIISTFAKFIVLIDDDFEDYTNTTGQVVPDGWSYNSSSGDLTTEEYDVKSVTEDGNTFMQIYSKGDRDGTKHVKLYKDFDNLAAPYHLNFKFKANYGNTSSIDTTVALFTMNDIERSMFQLKGDGTFSAIGGSGSTSLQNDPTIQKIKYAKEQWYNMSVTAIEDTNGVLLTTYVNGEKYDSRYTTDSVAFNGNKFLNRISFGSSATNRGYRELQLSYDDIKLYSGSEPLAIVSGSVKNGARGVSKSTDLCYTFNSHIDSKSLSTIRIVDSHGNDIDIDVNYNTTVYNAVDTKSIKINIDEDLEPNSMYTINLSGIKDLFGSMLAENNMINFYSGEMEVTLAITSYLRENGYITASVDVGSFRTSDADVDATIIAALYNKSGILADVKTTSEVLESVVDFTLGDGTFDSEYTLKVFCFDGLQTVKPMSKPAIQKYIGSALKLPSDFTTLPFNIYKDGVMSYSHDATAINMFGTDDAVEVFISANNKGGLGLTADNPINTGQFMNNVRQSKYETDNYILTLLDNVCPNIQYNDFKIDLATYFDKLMIRSGSASGFSWIGDILQDSDYESKWSESDGVYKAVLANEKAIYYPVNINSVDQYGMPKVYKSVTSVENCAIEKGTFYVDNVNVYVNPIEGENINDIGLMSSQRLMDFYNWTDQRIVLENIGFLSGSLDTYKFNPTTSNGELYIFNSKFFRGRENAMAIMGKYKVYMFDSVAAYASYDGFNYHSDNENSIAVEINCTSYGQGMYKVKSGDTNTSSNNASTAHESIKILRVGGRYWDCEGPIVADANNCYSISIGCDARNVIPTTTGTRSAYWYANDNSKASGGQKKYVIDCYAGGENLDDGGLYYTSSVGADEVYVLDFTGINTTNRTVNFVSWDDVMSGDWAN